MKVCVHKAGGRAGEERTENESFLFLTVNEYIKEIMQSPWLKYIGESE